MMPSASPLRVATLAHGHPTQSAGGAEIAAQTLHRALADHENITALHIACAPYGVIAPAGADEMFVETADLDDFRLVRRDPSEHQRLVAMLREFDPDVIHLHHVLGFGSDLIFALRRGFPRAVLVLTLHEYIPICHNRGQMVTPDGELCTEASPRACSRCFPDYAPGQFQGRAAALRALLSMADAFVAPSAFLASRYVQWGLPASRIHLVENALPDRLASPPREDRPRRRGRFAFFCQINPYKGLDLLLEAIALVAPGAWEGCSLAVHGSGLERQPPPFRARLDDLLKATGDRVTLLGPYRNSEVAALMSEADWLVVPSIWWENSPVVIQEAFASNLPVIAANLGGMAEKVRDGIDGMLFHARDPHDLARVLVDASNPQRWEQSRKAIKPPLSARTAAEIHVALYRALLANCAS